RLEGRQEGHEEGKLEGLAEGEKKGIAIGEVKGREAGKDERNMEIAKAMKSKGMSMYDIIDITGLAAEILAKL
ncbi:MAG: hypothetical protein NC308_04405, partial [Clostridium sp.]|nr:hypothetical protein [Clostridium sp.]